MKKILFYLAGFLLVNLFYSSCNDHNKIDEEQEQKEEKIMCKSLVNTSWHLIGFGNLQTQELREPYSLPYWTEESRKKVFTITFTTDSTFVGRGTANSFGGNYHSDYSKCAIECFRINQTKIDDGNPDEEYYFFSLEKMRTYEVSDTDLIIYCENYVYLKFKI